MQNRQSFRFSDNQCAKIVPIMLALCSMLLVTYCAPNYAGMIGAGLQLVEKLSEHFAPAPSEIVKWFKFHTRFQNPRESVTSNTSELHSIAKRCNFEGSLETMLRDCIVCGINNAVTQCSLLSEKDLTFKKALEIAQAMESAAQNVKELTSRPADKRPTEPVHHVTTLK